MTSPPEVHWRPATRIAFRFVFCYFMLYALCNGNATLWEALPWQGLRLAGWAAWPFNHAAVWAGHHVFHLQGIAATLHGSGFADRALDWIAAGVMLTVALIVTPIWSILDRKRLEYTTLYSWLRFTLRLCLAAGMYIYADIKIFPTQISVPYLAALNEPIGKASPLILLWTVLGLHPWYERLCGFAEFAAGTLLLLRRTALAGTLLAGVVISNIVLFDYFFDVPVRLYSTNLLLMTIVVAAPDVRNLFAFFWGNKPVARTQQWAPAPRSRNVRIAVLAFEACFLFAFWIQRPLQEHRRYAEWSDNIQHPSPLVGMWHVDTAVNASGMSQPFLTEEGLPMTDLYFEPSGHITARASDDRLWAGSNWDPKHFTMHLMSPRWRYLDYQVRQTDATHLVLLPASDIAAQYPQIHLSRVPLPDHYRLLERGFHVVDEWGFER